VRAAVVAALLSTVALAGCAAPAADATEGRFLVVAVKPGTAARALETSGLPAALVEDLNANLRLARDVEVAAADCGEANAFYDPETRRITMCHDLLEHVRALFEAAGHDDASAVENAVRTWTFVFFHEAGHAIIDVNGIPATGREEDAVDQLSALIVLAEEGGEGVALSAAEWFALEAGSADPDEASFADAHSLDAQRFHNILCWVYGSDPDRFADLAGGDGLTAERAEGCPEEYARMRAAWDALLGPWWKAA